MPSGSDVEESGVHDVVVGQRAFSRRVGIQYSLQVIINSLPLLLMDILAMTATIAACRILFFRLGISVGIDVSNCLLPIATGFVLLNFELGLYPGVKLSPVEELRRLAVSVTCMFVVWAVGVAVLTGSIGIRRWFLMVVYFACLFSLPICRTWLPFCLANGRTGVFQQVFAATMRPRSVSITGLPKIPTWVCGRSV